MPTPPAHPRKDRRAGLTKTTKMGSRVLTKFNQDVASIICERIALGEYLKDICAEEGFPSTTTVNRWVTMYPSFAEAYSAAKKLSAYKFEEDALELAYGLKDDPGSAVRVRAFELLLKQLRWSSERRNPEAFGPKGNTQVVVPIQFNTNLDMEHGTTDVVDDPYRLEFEVQPMNPHDNNFERAYDESHPDEDDFTKRRSMGRKWNKRKLKPRKKAKSE